MPQTISPSPETPNLDLAPELAQVGELPRDTSPIEFMGGTFYDRDENDTVLRYIQGTGRATLEPLASRQTKGTPWRNRVHYGSVNEEMFAPKALLKATDKEMTAITSLAQEARADELVAHIENQPEPITLIAQSADAQPALVAVHSRPDLFKNLILAFPSGVVRKQRRSEYLRQAASTVAEGRDKTPKVAIEPENSFKPSKPDSARDLTKLMMRRFAGSGGFRALASTISGYQGGLLHQLRQEKDSPAVSMVLGIRDISMKPDRIIESFVSANDVDFLLIVNSTHGIQGRKDLMDRILALTNGMEARSQQRKAAEARGEKFDHGSLADRLLFLEEGAYKVPDEEQERLRVLARKVPEA